MTEAEAVEAVSSLYETWYRAAVRYAWRLTGRWDVSEDAAQEAFLRLYRELRAGKEVRNLKAWTLTVIRAQVRSLMAVVRRHEAGHGFENVIEDAPADTRAPDFSAEDIQSLCAGLTKREEEVLFLRLAEMKYREIAERLDISLSSVNTLLARALRKLQQRSIISEPGAGPAGKQVGGDVFKTLH
jgi:RNA polymerase sigma-70 factor (ECF subfamily)